MDITKGNVCTYDVTLRRARVTIVAELEQLVLNILTESVALVVQHAKGMSPIIFSCGLSGYTIFFHIIS